MNLMYPRSSTIYKIPGTKTFRQGSAMIIGRWGENMQNKDKDVRKHYLSDGWTDADYQFLLNYLIDFDIKVFNEEQLQRIKLLLQIDQSGAEALIVSYLCRAGKFRDLFIYGVKPHVFVALHVFHQEWKKRCPDLDIDKFLNAAPKDLTKIEGWKILDKLIKSSDEWIASERFYYIAKMICHASNYGMRGATFAINVLQKSEGAIRLSEQQATFYLEAYHKLFPEIRIWHLEIQDELNRNKSVLHNLFGEPRQFNGIWGDTLFRDAYSFKPQSTVGQITNRAKARVQHHIENDDIIDTDQLQNGHDSILAQTLVGQENFIGRILQHYIEVELTSPRGEKFRMKSEAGVGFNWGPMKIRKDGSIYNPLGMREVRFI
jgi:hypothetical protein